MNEPLVLDRLRSIPNSIMVMSVALLGGCGTPGTCLEWEVVRAPREVCDRYSGGVCQARRWVEASANQCKRWKTPEDKKSAETQRPRGESFETTYWLRDDPERARESLKKGLPVNKRDSIGRLPLDYAAEGGDVEILRLLLDAGADVRGTNEDKRTALHYSARFGHVKAAELLIARGADVNAKDKVGRTPLHNVEKPEIASLLLRRGAKVNATDDAGSTPLSSAVILADLATVRLLLDAGADPNLADRQGRTPLSRAKLSANPDYAELLQKYGAVK